MKSGIYSITSPSGNQYIGSAINFKKRWRMHLFKLRIGKHHNQPLQRAFYKYGEPGFVFKKLLVCSNKNLLFYEQRAIDILNPFYNICKIAGSALGVKRSIETRLKQSGKKSELHCQNLSKSLKISLGTNEARLLNSQRQKIAQNKPERLIKNSETQKVSQMKPNVREAKAGRKVKCVETGKIFSCGHEAAEWCIEKGLTSNKNAFVWINNSIRNKRTAYGLTFIVYEEI